MGKYDEQMDDRSPSNSVNSMSVGVPAAVGPPASADGRSEDPYSLPGAPNKPLIIQLPSWQQVSGFRAISLTKCPHKESKLLIACDKFLHNVPVFNAFVFSYPAFFYFYLLIFKGYLTQAV